MIIHRPSESLHWYAKDGSPKYSVIGKNGAERSTTLRDARTLGLVPSVTTVLKCAASPGLEAWKLNQMMLAALTLPRVDGESEEDFIQRVIADSKQQAKAAAERGTAVHAALESFYQGVMYAAYAEHQVAVDKAVREVFGQMEWSTEKSFAHESGFGGKVDLHSTDGRGVVIDFKTKEFDDSNKDTVKAYDEHCMQLAAYRVGLGIPEARCANVFVSVTQPGLVVVHEWSQEDLVRGWNMFQSLLTFWKLKNKFNPSETGVEPSLFSSTTAQGATS